MQSQRVSIRWLFSAAVSLSLCFFSLTVRAQCDAGDGGADPTLYGVLRDTFPADQGINVPTDGVVRLRYFGRVPDPPTLCVRPRDAIECADGSATAVGDEVVWLASAPAGAGAGRLNPFTEYTVTFADASGGANRITFTTAGSPSPGPPSFAGISGVSATAAVSDPCDRSAVDITVRFNRASNTSSLGSTSWPDSDLEYVIYETRGPGISGARERDRVRLQRSGSVGDTSAQRSFRLSGRDASGPLCFNLQVIDPFGRPDGNAVEKCVNPTQGNYFNGCNAAPASARQRSSTALLTLAIASLFSLSRRNRRPAES